MTTPPKPDPDLITCPECGAEFELPETGAEPAGDVDAATAFRALVSAKRKSSAAPPPAA